MGIHSRINSNCKFLERSGKSDPFFVFSNDPFFVFARVLDLFVFSTFDVSSREPGRRRNHDLIIIDDGFACAPDRVREVTLAGRRRG